MTIANRMPPRPSSNTMEKNNSLARPQRRLIPMIRRRAKKLWFIRHGKGFGYNVTCRPIYRHGLIFTNSGISKKLFAIDPSGSGDVTDTHIRWTTRRGVSNIPAPLVVGDNLYMISDSGGMVSCFDAKSGDQIFSERLGGLQNHWISPICADGKIYFFSKDGISSVIEASSEFKILSKNESDTVFVSMPAIVERFNAYQIRYASLSHRQGIRG